MGRKTLKVKGYRPEEIKALFNSVDEYRIRLRLYAVYQVSLGQPSRKLEDVYNMSFKQITNWVHRFEEEGIDGLRDRRGRGRKTRLTQDQKDQLTELIANKTPEEFGYKTRSWTGPLLIKWIAEHYSIPFKKAQIYNVVKQLGFSYKKSKGFYSKANPRKQEKGKEEPKNLPENPQDTV